MQFCLLLTLSFLAGVAVSDQNEYEVLGAAKPVRDRFRMMMSNVNEQRVEDEIQDFTTYGCEKMVVIRNRAQAEFKLSCRSFHDAPKTQTVQQGNAFVFTFRPQKNGATKFWCALEYQQYIVRFDVYNEDMTYMCPRDIDEVYQYTVKHDGVYVDGKKGSEGTKIRALSKGHNRYIVWEEYVDNQTDGFLISGYIDGGMCHDLPDQFNDKAAAVTVCHNHCIHLYEHFGCRGKMQTVQASGNCTDSPLISELAGKLSAIKGC